MRFKLYKNSRGVREEISDFDNLEDSLNSLESFLETQVEPFGYLINKQRGY